MKYLVMECRSAYAVVLGDDGTFQKVANLRYEVGQTVTNVVPLRLPEEARSAPGTGKKRWLSTLAAAAACLALVIASVFLAGQLPYASVFMTINPEVRIDVNRRDMVVGVEGINADGEALLHNYDHRKKNLDTVMDELVERAIQMGYLHEGGKITLDLDGNDDWITSHDAYLNQHLNAYLTDRITVTIDIGQKQPVPTDTAPSPGTSDDYGDSDYDSDADYDDNTPVYPEDDGSDYDDDDGQTDYQDRTDAEYDGDDEDDSDYDDDDGDDEDDDDDEDDSDYDDEDASDYDTE